MKKNKNKFLENFYGLENKKIIITGCSGQLGSCLVDTFLKFGCTVIGLDISKPKKKIKGEFFFYQLDISDFKENNLIFSKIFKKFKKIDSLINNAGVAVFKPFTKRSEEELDWVININLKSYFYSIKNFYKFSDKKTNKSIINISSIYSIVSPDPRIYSTNDRKSSEIYGATKAGVNQMTRYFAIHLSDKNIRVNTVIPGGIYNSKSPQNKNFIKKYSYRNPLKRMAKTEEIAGAVIYLSSNSSTYTNGHNLVVDGGMSSW
jgi:NAD(P)-dependent dehydrogenase (short-subunit alcohol dehydrogenase family)